MIDAARAADPDLAPRRSATPWTQTGQTARLAALPELARSARFDGLAAGQPGPAGRAPWPGRRADGGRGRAPPRAAAPSRRRLAQLRPGRGAGSDHPRREEAIRYYTAARSIRPETATSWRTLLEARGSAEAIAVFQDLVRLRPTTAGTGLPRSPPEEAGPRRGRCGPGRGRRGLPRGDPAQARRRLRPRQPRLRPERQGKLDEAIAEYREAIRLRPDDATTHFNLGNALGRRGSWTRRSPSTARRSGSSPTTPTPTSNLGVALLAQGKLDEAIAEYREAIRLKPD